MEGTPPDRSEPALRTVIAVDLTTFKTFDVQERKMDLGLQVFNLTGHYNPRDVIAVVQSRRFGEFTNNPGITFGTRRFAGEDRMAAAHLRPEQHREPERPQRIWLRPVPKGKNARPCSAECRRPTSSAARCAGTPTWDSAVSCPRWRR